MCPLGVSFRGVTVVVFVLIFFVFAVVNIFVLARFLVDCA